MVQMQASVTSQHFGCAVPVEVSVSRFLGQSGVNEYHLMIRPTEYESTTAQMEWLYEAYQDALACLRLDRGTCVLRRFFCSDLSNQAPALHAYPFADPHDPDEPCAISQVSQPPAPPAKVALWAYHISDSHSTIDKRLEGESLLLRRGDLAHVWTTGVTCPDAGTSYSQTEGIFRSYNRILQSRGSCLENDVVRTWFFVRDIDSEYRGLVEARRDVFAEHGLTPDTHFVASTGIGGASADVGAKVMMDAYAIPGVNPGQIDFLSAPDHLSPTHVYGVTFERGVSIAYRERKHVMISGTASIDHAGRIVYSGNVFRQLERTLANVEALLHTAGATLRDVCSSIVYVRDPSDVGMVQRELSGRFGDSPALVVVAPVCRPGWLIEVECQAIVPAANPTLPDY